MEGVINALDNKQNALYYIYLYNNILDYNRQLEQERLCLFSVQH